MENPSEKKSPPRETRDSEEQIPGWKNPYVLYIMLTLGLFFFLVFMGYLALTQGWIPNRGVG